MTRALAYAIFIAFIVAIVIYGTREHRVNGLAMPLLVQSDAPSCPKLPNPCATMNCNRVNTKGIA